MRKYEVLVNLQILKTSCLGLNLVNSNACLVLQNSLVHVYNLQCNDIFVGLAKTNGMLR